MTLALRGFIAGLVCASVAAYLYEPNFYVLMAAFWVGHVIGIVAMSIFYLLEEKE